MADELEDGGFIPLPFTPLPIPIPFAWPSHPGRAASTPRPARPLMHWGTFTRCTQHAIVQDSRPQTSPALQGRLGTGTKGLLHPVTRLARLDAKESNALDCEVPPNERLQICSARNNVTAENGWRFLVPTKLVAQRAIDFVGEEGDLAFEIRLVVKITVALDPASGHTLKFIDLHYGVFPRRLPVMAAVVVSGRYKQVLYVHDAQFAYAGRR